MKPGGGIVNDDFEHKRFPSDQPHCNTCGKSVFETSLTVCVWCKKDFCNDHGAILSDGPICDRCLEADDKTYPA